MGLFAEEGKKEKKIPNQEQGQRAIRLLLGKRIIRSSPFRCSRAALVDGLGESDTLGRVLRLELSEVDMTRR